MTASAAAISPFAGLAQAKTSERSAYLNPGLYKVQVKKCIWKTTRGKGDAFIMEFTVLESNFDPAVHVLPNGQKVAGAPNETGTTAAWYQSCQDRDIGFGALKLFAANITNSDPEDPKFVAQVEGLMGSFLAGALDGVTLNVEVTTILTKQKKDFSLHKWSAAA